MPELELAVTDVKPGAALESQSGLLLLRPRIHGAWAPAVGPRKVAAIVMHPTSNFMGHDLIQPLAERGIACMGLSSRYAGNDSLLLMERVIQDWPRACSSCAHRATTRWSRSAIPAALRCRRSTRRRPSGSRHPA